MFLMAQEVGFVKDDHVGFGRGVVLMAPHNKRVIAPSEARGEGIGAKSLEIRHHHSADESDGGSPSTGKCYGLRRSRLWLIRAATVMRSRRATAVGFSVGGGEPKNRMREILTSGTVGGAGGNPGSYPEALERQAG